MYLNPNRSPPAGISHPVRAPCVRSQDSSPRIMQSVPTFCISAHAFLRFLWYKMSVTHGIHGMACMALDLLAEVPTCMGKCIPPLDRISIPASPSASSQWRSMARIAWRPRCAWLGACRARAVDGAECMARMAKGMAKTFRSIANRTPVAHCELTPPSSRFLPKRLCHARHRQSAWHAWHAWRSA
jgi:hypothetical protein